MSSLELGLLVFGDISNKTLEVPTTRKILSNSTDETSDNRPISRRAMVPGGRKEGN
jgi:hypothetical protein